MRILVVLGFSLLAACGGPSQEQQDFVRKHYGQVLLEYDPLCVYQGPFPWRRSKHILGCDRCGVLEELGLVTSRADSSVAPNDTLVELTELGKSLYREDHDSGFASAVEARRAKAGDPVGADESALFDRPRLCFGKSKIHSVTDALAPQRINNEAFQSFKVVLEAVETLPQLFEPQFAVLGFKCAAASQPGKPTLCAEHIVTFVRYGDGEVELRNDVRYGAWINQ